MIFFLIFFILPLTEVMVFVAVGGEIGLLSTLMLCVLTALIGSFLVHKQGIEVLFRGRAALMEGVFPAQELFDGFCIVVAGAMLITPGFVTDTIGFSLLIPAVRRFAQERVTAYVEKRTAQSRGRCDLSHPVPGDIEGTYQRLDRVDD